MYSVDSLAYGLTLLCDDTPLAAGIRPVLMLDEGGLYAPPLKRQAVTPRQHAQLGTSTRFAFHYGDETLEVSLYFESFADVLIGSIAYTSQSPLVGGKNKGVAAVGGVRLQVACLEAVQGVMANYHHSDWWTRPHFDADIHTLPPRTLSFLWHSPHGCHHLMPLCDDIFKTELCGSENGLEIWTSAYDGGYSNFEALTFVLASSDDPFLLADKTVTAGMTVLGKPFQTRQHKRYPPPLEYIGWCSWDAFYYEVSAEGVLNKAAEFARLGLPMRWFILDAGWSDDVDYHLNSFEPQPQKFPNGLSPVIDALKKTYGLHWVGVWHTLIGYWKGIQPNSPLAERMHPYLYTTNSGKLIPAPQTEKAFMFWNTWHRALKGQGVDFVKVDYQSVLVNVLKHDMAIGKAAHEAHEALEASVGKNFDGMMINCMGMASENVWHRAMSSLARNSDDFFPHVEDNFKEHAFQNAYNSYFHAPFFWGDWDMFWTKHSDAVQHAVLRAISGGPIYVSDPPNQTLPELLWPLMLSDGRILRADQPALPTHACLFRNPQRDLLPLTLWNRTQGAGILAAFNIHLERKPVTGTISASHIPGLPGEQFILYDYFRQRAQVVGRETVMDIVLEDKAFGLYLFVPVQPCFTPLGLINKYLMPAVIAEQTHFEHRTIVLLKEGGVFAWAAARPCTLKINGQVRAFETADGFCRVDCGDITGRVWLEIEECDDAKN